MNPATEPMLMIPTPAASLAHDGQATARIMRTEPKKFVSSTALISSRLVSSTAPSSATPALFTSTSMRPAAAMTLSLDARLYGGVVTDIKGQHGHCSLNVAPRGMA